MTSHLCGKCQAKGSTEGSEGIVNTNTHTPPCTHARTWHSAAGGLRTGAANNSGNPAQPGPRPWGRGLQFQTRSSQVKLPSYYLNLFPSKLESPPRHFAPTQAGHREAQIGILCRGEGL